MILSAFDRVEVVSPEPLCPDGSIVALYICVLLKLAGLNVDQSDSGALGPVLQPLTDVFRAVDRADRHGLYD